MSKDIKITYQPLFNILEERGLNMERVIENTGLSYRTTAKLRKNQNVEVSTLLKIADYLDVDISDLIKRL